MTAATPFTVPRRLAFSVVAFASIGAAIALIGPVALAFWLVPDVALLAGMSKEFAGDGRLAPGAVPLYNALHSLPGPVALGVVAAILASPFVAGLALVWLSHITADRALGYGLRTKDGDQRG